MNGRNYLIFCDDDVTNGDGEEEEDREATSRIPRYAISPMESIVRRRIATFVNKIVIIITAQITPPFPSIPILRIRSFAQSTLLSEKYAASTKHSQISSPITIHVHSKKKNRAPKKRKRSCQVRKADFIRKSGKRVYSVS